MVFLGVNLIGDTKIMLRYFWPTLYITHPFYLPRNRQATGLIGQLSIRFFGTFDFRVRYCFKEADYSLENLNYIYSIQNRYYFSLSLLG